MSPDRRVAVTLPSAVLSTMAWCIIPLFMSSLIEFILISMNRQQDVAKTWALTFVVNVPLNILLIRSYGASGAAMAVLASFVLLTLVQCVILAVHLKIPNFFRMMTRLFPPLAMVLLFLYWFQWNGWYRQVAGAVSAIAFFIAAHFMIATISLEEIRSFAKKMHSQGS